MQISDVKEQAITSTYENIVLKTLREYGCIKVFSHCEPMKNRVVVILKKYLLLGIFFY